MKNTNSLVKHRFFVLLSCLLIFVLWVSINAIMLLVISKVEFSFVEVSVAVYSWISLIFGPLLTILASLLTLPFALTIFKRLNVQRPRLSAIALVTSFFFAFCILNLIVSVNPLLVYQNLYSVVVIAAVCVALSAIMYGLVVRKLSKRVSRGWLLAILVGLPILVLLAKIIYRISVTFM